MEVGVTDGAGWRACRYGRRLRVEATTTPRKRVYFAAISDTRSSHALREYHNTKVTVTSSSRGPGYS